MASQTITLKLTEKLYEKLEAIALAHRLQSPSLAAKQILITALLSGAGDGSGGDRLNLSQDSLYSIQADLEHLIVEVNRLSQFTARLIEFQGAIGELLLINLAKTDEKETAKVISSLIEAVFTDE